jgi:hypothetical protein
MNTRWAAMLGLGVACSVVGGVLYSRHARSAQASARAAAALSAAVARGDPVLRVPHVSGAIVLDGDTDDPGWLRAPGPARTRGFLLPSGKAAIPYSEARLVWGDGYLYLALYASDEDIEVHGDQPDQPVALDDAFRLTFARPGVEYEIDVSPTAVITDSVRRRGGEWDLSWNSGAHASKEIDGSLNEPKNRDEEWAIELAIPLESLDMAGERGEMIRMSLSRCDSLRGAPPICAGWGDGSAGYGRGTIVLE